jgi:hypothetical protein
MALPDFYYSEAELLVGLLATFAVGVLTFRRPAYGFARGCTWLGVFLFVSVAIVWGTTTKEPLKVWLPVVAVIGAAGAVGLTLILRTVNAAETGDLPTPPVQAELSGPTLNGTNQGPGQQFNFQGPSTNNFNYSAPPQVQTAPQHDPDTIYQRNSPVGSVVGVNVMPSQSAVFFNELNGVGDLDQSKPFEYRNYTLVIQKSDGLTLMGMSRSGSFKQNILPNVLCKILDPKNASSTPEPAIEKIAESSWEPRTDGVNGMQKSVQVKVRNSGNARKIKVVAHGDGLTGLGFAGQGTMANGSMDKGQGWVSGESLTPNSVRYILFFARQPTVITKIDVSFD